MSEKAMSLTQVAERYGVSLNKFKADMQNKDGLVEELMEKGFFSGASRALYPNHIEIIEKHFGLMPPV